MRWLACSILAVFAACSGPRTFGPFEPRPVRLVEKWQVHAGGRVVGTVTEVEIEDPENPERFYQVRSANGQWLGVLDDQMRVYQRVPFSMEDLFLGIHPMEQGLALLYEEEGPLELIATGDGTATEASSGGAPKDSGR